MDRAKEGRLAGARIKDAHGRCVSLRQTQIIGRSRRVEHRVENRAVSAQHACIAHVEGRWFVRDLGSRNGTKLNGERLLGQERRSLREGDCLEFGCQDERWWVVDTSPPCATATSGGVTIEAEGGVLVLPSVEAPEAMIALRGESWMMDHDGEWLPVQDGQRVLIAGRLWRLNLPGSDAASTATTVSAEGSTLVLAQLELEFWVDGDSIALSLKTDRERLELREHATHRLLLLLAEERLADKARGVDASRAGFRHRDEILSRLGIGIERLNVDVHRARRQFAKANVSDAADVVERRPRGFELRLGANDVAIFRGQRRPDGR